MKRKQSIAANVVSLVSMLLLLSGCTGSQVPGLIDDTDGGVGGISDIRAGCKPGVLFASLSLGHSDGVTSFVANEGYACWTVTTSGSSITGSVCLQTNKCADNAYNAVPGSGETSILGIHDNYRYIYESYSIPRFTGYFYRCPLSDPDVLKCVPIAYGEVRAPAISTTGGRAFWFSNLPVAVSTCTLPACSDRVDHMIASDQQPFAGTITSAAAPNAVYWMINLAGSPTTSLYSYTAGGSVAKLADLPGRPGAYAADAKGSLYWFDADTYKAYPMNVMTCALASCSPRVFAPAGDAEAAKYAFLPSLTTSDKYVYWQSFKLDGTKMYLESPLVRCPLSGCTGSPQTVMPEIRNFWLQGGNLYWNAGATGKISDDGYSIRMTPEP